MQVGSVPILAHSQPVQAQIQCGVTCYLGYFSCGGDCLLLPSDVMGTLCRIYLISPRSTIICMAGCLSQKFSPVYFPWLFWRIANTQTNTTLFIILVMTCWAFSGSIIVLFKTKTKHVFPRWKKVIKSSISIHSANSYFLTSGNYFFKLQTLVSVTMIEHAISVISHRFTWDIGNSVTNTQP